MGTEEAKEDGQTLRCQNHDLFARRASLPGRVCHGGHQPCWCRRGHSGQGWSSACLRKEARLQAAGTWYPTTSELMTTSLVLWLVSLPTPTSSSTSLVLLLSGICSLTRSPFQWSNWCSRSVTPSKATHNTEACGPLVCRFCGPDGISTTASSSTRAIPAATTVAGRQRQLVRTIRPPLLSSSKTTRTSSLCRRHSSLPSRFSPRQWTALLCLPTNSSSRYCGGLRPATSSSTRSRRRRSRTSSPPWTFPASSPRNLPNSQTTVESRGYLQPVSRPYHNN